jgi:ketosteroid isomerase-like protein
VQDGQFAKFREYADTANLMEALALTHSHA